MRVLIPIVILLIALTPTEAAPPSFSSDEQEDSAKASKENSAVYGEFIRTFTFAEAPRLPIVQPGGSLTFPMPTVPPVGVTYVEEPTRVGLLVPRGTYLMSWVLNPSEGASVTLLVNGLAPTTAVGALRYTQALTTSVVRFEYLVQAPLDQNLISLVNTGLNLISLNGIPNRTVGSTAILTQIRVQRISHLAR